MWGGGGGRRRCPLAENRLYLQSKGHFIRLLDNLWKSGRLITRERKKEKFFKFAELTAYIYIFITVHLILNLATS